MTTLRKMERHGEALGSTAALKHLSDVTKLWSDAQYLRTQYDRQGSAEGMVDAAIRSFRGEAMDF
jgi:carboxylate-amine ligase